MPLPLNMKNTLGWADMTINDLAYNFNVFKIPDYDNAPEPFIGHIFMSRPSLAIGANYGTMRMIAQLHGIMNDPYGKVLAMTLDADARQKWLPLISLRAKNYSVLDIELKTVEKGGTFYGHTVTYAKHSEDHKVGGSFSIDFRNDIFLSVLKLMYIWVFYIYNVSKNDSIVVNSEFEEKAILDYCASLYYIATKRDSHKIVYWEKLVGVRPKKIPLSIFNWDDSIKVEDTVTIDFDYGVRSDPMDPSILMDINVLNNLTPGEASDIMANGFPANWDASTGVEDKTGFIRPIQNPFIENVKFAKGPYVVARTTAATSGTPTIEYFLEYK